VPGFEPNPLKEELQSHGTPHHVPQQVIDQPEQIHVKKIIAPENIQLEKVEDA
jgi:hypothetical protein